MEEEYLLPEIYQEDLKETGKFTDTQFRDLMNWINDHRFYKLLITINGKDLSSNLPIKITGTVLKSSNYRLYRRTLLVLSNSIEYDGQEHKFPYILKIKKSLSEYLINFLRSLGGERLVQDAQLISENIPFLKENLHENLTIYDYHLENNFEPDEGEEVVFLKKDMDEAMKWLEKKSRSYNIDTIIDGNIRNKKDMRIILNGFISFTKETSEHMLIQIENIYKHPELEKKSSKDFSEVKPKDEFNLNKLKFSNQKEHSDIIPNIMYLKLKESTKKLRNLIEVKDLTIAFGDRVVIDHINFNIKEGEIIGIIGESGSGKSITVKSLLGQIDYEGKVNVMGIDSNKTNKIAQFIGYVPEDISLIYEDFTPMENLIHFGRQYDLEEEQISRRAKKILKDLEIPQFMDSAVKNLSGGQKKRVSIAISLIHEPELLILDEPTSGLDPMMRFELWKFLDFINKNYNITLIVISHYLDEIEYSDKSAIYLKGIGMHDFDTPSNLKASLPGKGKALEIVLKDINLNILGLLENISDIDEIIQRGKRIRLLADQFSDGIIGRLRDLLDKNKIEYLAINKDVVVDMVDYFTVKSRHLGSGKELGNFEKYNLGEESEY